VSDRITSTIEPGPEPGPPRRRRRVAVITGVALVASAGAFGAISVSGAGGFDDGGVGSAERSPSVLVAVGEAAASTPDMEATRLEIDRYLDDLQQLVETDQLAGANGSPLLVPAVDLSQAVDAARTLVDELDAPQLEAMQTIIDVTPGWADQPELLQEAVEANPYSTTETAADGPGSVLQGYAAPATLQDLSTTGAAASIRQAARAASAGLTPQAIQPHPRSPGDPAGYLSSCQGTPPNLRGLFYSYWIAAQIAGAAGAVAAGIPDAVTYIALTIITGVIFGVANGIAIGLQYELSKAQDCAAALSNATLVSTYPTHPSAVTPANPAGYTPASTQVSVNALTSIVGGIQQLLTTIDTKVVAILQSQLLVINAVGAAQSAANQVQAIALDLQLRTDDLLANVGSPGDVAVEADRSVVCVSPDAPAGTPPPDPPPACNTANGLANTTDVRMDTLLANTADFQELSVRMEIERALADPSQPIVALFARPSAQGGYLETVRDIVTATLANQVAAGQRIGNAETFLATGNSAYAGGNFNTAFADYAKAYRAAVS
jgi:hypothetical protein